MRKICNFFYHTLLVSSISFQTLAVKSDSELSLKSEANEIVKRFTGELKPKLKQAIQSGGLSNAVKVCAEDAPKIAQRLNKETSWSVKRVSLKARNINANPDAFEMKILKRFEHENKAKNTTLEYAKINNKNYRYMRAQRTGNLCLNCHGESIAPAVKSTLAEYYPQDQATGYKLGDVRGAISLIKNM